MIQNKKTLEKVVSPDELPVCEIIKLTKLMLEDENCGLCRIIDELKDNSKKWDLENLTNKDDLKALIEYLNEINYSINDSINESESNIMNVIKESDCSDLADKSDVKLLQEYLSKVNDSVSQSESNIMNVIKESDCSNLADKSDIKLLQEYMAKTIESVYGVKSDIKNLYDYINEIYYNSTKPRNLVDSRNLKSNHSSEYIQKDEMVNAMNFFVEKINKAFGDFENFNKIKADFNLVFDL